MRAPVVKKFSPILLTILLLAAALGSAQSLTPVSAQNLTTVIQTLKAAYSSSGSIVSFDEHSIIIEPKMPSPVCGLPSNKNGKTEWAFYTFPLASITVPLASVDETLIAEDRVFTNPAVTNSYKPGDVGDTTMVVIAGVPGKQFHTLTYDRDKLTHLGPGPHSSKEYAQAPDDTEAFGLTFADPAAARAFEAALKQAVIIAKAKQATP